MLCFHLYKNKFPQQKKIMYTGKVFIFYYCRNHSNCKRICSSCLSLFLIYFMFRTNVPAYFFNFLYIPTPLLQSKGCTCFLENAWESSSCFSRELHNSIAHRVLHNILLLLFTEMANHLEIDHCIVLIIVLIIVMEAAKPVQATLQDKRETTLEEGMAKVVDIMRELNECSGR